MKKKSKSTYFNRELSWLAFNQRVMDQATLKRHPLLERVKFLAICASNLDEFFMVRVGGLQMVAGSGATNISDIVGWTPDQQLNKIRTRVRKMYRDQSECLLNDLEPKLVKHGIERIKPEQLTDLQRDELLRRFKEESLPTLSPIAIEEHEDFPTLSGSRLCVCVRLKNDENTKLGPAGGDKESIEEAADRKSNRYVVLPFGRSSKRLWTIASESGYRYILFEDVLKLFLGEFFGNQEVLEATPFRLTRNGDVVLDEDGRADLLMGMREMLEARRRSDCVRLEVDAAVGPETLEFLQQAIDVSDENTYLIDGPLKLSDFFGLSGIAGFKKLKDEPWPPQPSPEFSESSSIFETIAAGDRLLYHPYQAYDHVVDLLAEAAVDPDVIAIKQTLYRASSNSKIVQALETAAANGINVTAIVELKARFDEAQNIYWARHLEDAGVDVIYGVRGLKTHAKMCMVVRREPTGIRRYMHFGTGNYNESTARIYSDVSYFTCDEQLGLDTVHFFNSITGLSVPQPFGKLIAAPIDLRETLLELIQIETESAERGETAAITAKVNSLVDKAVIDALYRASQAGVKVRLNIRGICCLVPGKKGLSENIKVISVVDRLLEHARVFSFHHSGDEKLYISSADWMGRNLDRRVELMVPIDDKACKLRLLRILDSYFEDNVSAMELTVTGEYVPVSKRKKQDDVRCQQVLYEEACQIYTSHTNPRTTVFETHRGK